MKILDIEFQNFGPYQGKHRFVFADRGLTLVLGDNQDEPRMNSNGAGKSELFDALDWCFFGVPPRKDHADSVINDVVGKDCRVVTRAQTDFGSVLTVDRSRKFCGHTHRLVVCVDGDPVEALDTDELQRQLERILGIDREVFHAAVLFGQTDLVHYADAKDGARMEVLTKILCLGAIDDYLENTKKRLLVYQAEVTEQRLKLANWEGQLEGLRGLDYGEQVKAWGLVQVDKVTRCTARLDELKGWYAANVGAAAARDTCQAQIVWDQQQLSVMRPPDGTRHTMAVAAEASARVNLESVNLELGKALRAWQGLAQAGSLCPECGQVVSAEHVAAKRQWWLREVARLEEAKRSATEFHGQWYAEQLATQNKEAEEAYQQEWAKRRDALAELKAQVLLVNANLAQVPRVVCEIQEVGQELNTLFAQKHPYTELMAEQQVWRVDLEEKCEGVRCRFRAQEDEVARLEFWLAGFGPKGLKSYILDSRLQELSDAANHWVRLLTGGTFWVRFESQKKTRGKKLVNSPDIRVFHYEPDGTVSERNYCSWSGGEKKRVSFAVDFGLSRLIANRATYRYDLLILDEAFRHLDRLGKEAVVEMLQQLVQEKSSIFVVDHDSDLQGAFENRVVAAKKNRASRLEESTSHGEQEKTTWGVPASTAGNGKRKRQPRHRPASTGAAV